MTNRFKSLVTVASLCLFSPLPAMAQNYRVDYAGIITAGSDADNVFGLSQLPSLAGLAFNASVGYSVLAAGTRTTTQNSDEVTGGLAFGTDQVISSIFFIIGGKSFSFSPDYYGDVYTSPTVLTTYGYDTLGNSFQTYFLPDESNGPSMFGVPFSGTGAGDTGGATTQYSYLITGQDNIDFNAINATVSSVPEPNTWAMLLFGFGAVGLALRRRGRDTFKSSIEA